MEKLMFGAGCFWGVEEKLKKINGVKKVTVGYSGGETNNPTYKDVCTGTTGHAEVALVEYDESLVNTEALLELFWSIHDPTTLNQQGPDIGSQYRSAIFYFNEKQKPVIEKSKKTQQNILKKEVVTQVLPAKPFWPAEEYHQCYLEKKNRGSK